jgi:mannose-6-phosphate isomerase-like protein (cupin superfamily)
MTVKPKVIRSPDFSLHRLHGTGAIRRAIYPDTAGSQRLFVGIAEFEPGTAPHVLHRHDSEIVGTPGERRRLTYAPDFEEFYYVVAGAGEMQWRDSDGRSWAEPVNAGDCVFFPPGVAEHRVFNTGTTPMRVLYGGAPPATIETVD